MLHLLEDHLEVDKMSMSEFEKIENSKEYQDYLKMLSEPHRKQAEDYLQKLCEDFEQKILSPLEILSKR